MAGSQDDFVRVVTGSLIRRRMALMLAVFLGLFLVLAGQLFRLQILESGQLQQRARRQWTQESIISPRRGDIVDRNGTVLAVSATAYTVCASPRQVKDARALAQVLSPILDMEEEQIEKPAADRTKGGVTLKRQVSPEVARQLRTMLAASKQSQEDVLSGVYLEEDQKRHYPLGDFASQLIGLTTVDGVDQSGLEKSLNKYLSGKAGRILDEIDGKGRQLETGAREYIPSVDGSRVVLTLDAGIQAIVEQAAREAMTVNGAKAVRALVMDPVTGQILAMCAKPAFDLNHPPRDDVELLNSLMRNRVVADAYEPGSTFKVLTTAAALESGVTRVDEGFTCTGSITVEGGKIRCWGNPHGAQTMARALENSCNPVFVELGLRLGVDRFYDYLEAFGLGKKTGVDIAGEGAGILIPRQACKRVDIARIGFGQSVAVTPIQLLTAASAAVNGGKLMKPYIVDHILSPEGEVIYRGESSQAGTPISSATSRTLRQLLEGVVRDGGGRNAYLETYRVGGKTGTAQLYVNGVVSSDTHIGSFMGFAPIDNPRIALLFIVDEASVRPDFGSVTAAPFARQIMERSLAHLGVSPQAGEEEQGEMLPVPRAAGLDSGQAVKVVKEAGFTPLLEGTGSLVKDQLPQAGVKMARRSLVVLYTGDGEGQKETTVPDVIGLTIGEANRLLKGCGLVLEMEGTGVAVSQTPQARSQALAGDRVKVRFEKPGAG